MSQTITLTFEPLDVLVFKDYRGLEAADQHEARTLGASPTVMRGCVRGALFRQLGADFGANEHFGVEERWHAWLGGRSQQGTLRMRGPWIVEGIRDEVPQSWFPAPIGLPLLCHTKASSTARMVTVSELDSSLAPRFSETPTAQGLRVRPAGDKDREGIHWVNADRSRCKPLDDLFMVERRVGIGRSPETRSVTEDLFFYQDTLRFAENVGLAVEIEVDDDAQKEQVMKLCGQSVPLGGRGHRTLLRVLERSLLPPRTAPTRRVWFITPILRGGDLHPEGAQVQSLFAAESPPIGGFDMAKRRPRPLQSTLPAGTVLTLTTPPPSNHRWGQSEEAWNAGYGCTLSLGDDT